MKKTKTHVRITHGLLGEPEQTVPVLLRGVVTHPHGARESARGISSTKTLCNAKHSPLRGIPFASGFAENVAMGGRPRTWPCGVAVAVAGVAVRGGCVLGKATVRPSGFWPYCTGWNNLDARVHGQGEMNTAEVRKAGPPRWVLGIQGHLRAQGIPPQGQFKKWGDF